MKKAVFIFSIFLIGFSTRGQQVEKKKNAKIAFEVDGICGMCKKRIETAALKTKGIKFAIWDVKTHQLNVILNEQKISLELRLYGSSSEIYLHEDDTYKIENIEKAKANFINEVLEIFQDQNKN